MSKLGTRVGTRTRRPFEDLRITPSGDSPDPADRAGDGDGESRPLVSEEPAPITADPADALNSRDPAVTFFEIEDGETTLFEAAITAFHADEFQRAESLFLEEAERTLDASPQRAAIAFRQAALAARQAGNVDGSDHWMRLAGREYLRVSEDDRTPLPFIREAAVMAAKCFLSVENLHVATKGLRRAQAIESVLRADDDLMAGIPGIPFRHGEAGSTLRSRPDGAADITGLAVGPSTSSPGNPTAGTQPVHGGPVGGQPGAFGHHAGWLKRLRPRRPSRNVA